MLGTSVGDERYDDRLADPSPRRGAPGARPCTARRSTDAAAIDRDGARRPTRRTTLDVARGDRPAVPRGHRAPHRPADRRQPPVGPGPGCSARSRRSSRPTPPSGSSGTRRGCGRSPRTWRPGPRSRRDGVAAGVTAPRVVAERSIGQLERLLALPAEDSPALAARPTDDAARERHRRGRRATIVNPAYAGFLEALRDYLPHATETIGLSALPDGEAMYAAEILSWTSLPLDPREVHELGERALRRDPGGAARASPRTLGYASPARRSPRTRRAAPTPPRRPEALVALAEDQVRRSWDAAAPCFGRLPSANCEVRAVEAFREADMPMAFYNPPTEDGSRPGVYYINTLRPAEPRAALDRERHLPRGEPRAPLPDRARAGDAGPAAAPAVRRRSSRAARSAKAGACTRSASPTRWASTSTTGSASACSRTRPCAPAASSPTPASTRWAGTARRPIAKLQEGGDAAHRRRDRGRPLHRDAGPGPLLHDRDDRDRERARGGRGA